MNFIGHAQVALWTSSSPAFVLGAMLPDFASMAGTRLAARLHSSDEPELAAGVSLHHLTDEVFHGSAPFIALMQEAMDALTGRGVAR